jgi:hypothetical protein
VASWLGTATQLQELDLGGNGEFGEAAMEALVSAAEKHGHLVVKADDVAMTGLPREIVVRFEQVNKSNMATSYLVGSSA